MTGLNKITDSLGKRPAWSGKLLILLEMIKIEHTIFALPFAFMGALLAAQWLTYGPPGIFHFAGHGGGTQCCHGL